MKKIHEMIATVFGLGSVPFASGTAGSLAGLLLCMLLHKYVILYVLVFAALFIAGVISSERVEKDYGFKDPSEVIIDEFACVFMVYLFIPLTPFYVITGFILYRVIDILKIPPMKAIERIKGGWGIMLDDLMAGIYANLVLQVIKLSGLLS